MKEISESAVASEVNSDPFIYDMAYALNVIGYTNNSY